MQLNVKGETVFVSVLPERFSDHVLCCPFFPPLLFSRPHLRLGNDLANELARASCTSSSPSSHGPSVLLHSYYSVL